MNKGADYQVGNQYAQRLSSDSLHQVTLGLPLVFTDQAAKNIADIRACPQLAVPYKSAVK